MCRRRRRWKRWGDTIGRSCWGISSLIKEVPESRQFGMPFVPLCCRNEEAVLHVAKKLHFHNMNFLDGYSRNFSPGFVGVCVIVKNYRQSISDLCRRYGCS